MSGYCTTQNLEFMNLKASVAMSLPSRAYPTNKTMSSTQPDRFHYALANYTTLVFDVDPDPGDRPAEAAQVAICSKLSKGDHSFLPNMAAAESRNNPANVPVCVPISTQDRLDSMRIHAQQICHGNMAYLFRDI